MIATTLTSRSYSSDAAKFPKIFEMRPAKLTKPNHRKSNADGILVQRTETMRNATVVYKANANKSTKKE